MHKERFTSGSIETTLEKASEAALEAVFDKKGRDVVVLDLAGICTFSDRFILCTGTSARQTQAIADHINEKLRLIGVRAAHIEGYGEGEWILMDYLDFVVHIFTERAREFYDLERLWRAGKRRQIHELAGHRA